MCGHLPEDEKVERDGPEAAQDPGGGCEQVVPGVGAQQNAGAVGDVGSNRAAKHRQAQALCAVALPVLHDLGHA